MKACTARPMLVRTVGTAAAASPAGIASGRSPAWLCCSDRTFCSSAKSRPLTRCVCSRSPPRYLVSSTDRGAATGAPSEKPREEAAPSDPASPASAITVSEQSKRPRNRTHLRSRGSRRLAAQRHGRGTRGCRRRRRRRLQQQAWARGGSAVFSRAARRVGRRQLLHGGAVSSRCYSSAAGTRLRARLVGLAAV